jgi:hypothetical protein
MAQQSSSIYTFSVPSLPYLGLCILPLTLPTFPISLPFPPPPVINSGVSHSFPPPTNLSSTSRHHSLQVRNHTLQIIPTILLFHSSCPAVLSITSAIYKAHPTFCGGVVTLTNVATLRRAHHRAFKKSSVGNRTAPGTRTCIFDLSTHL